MPSHITNGNGHGKGFDLDVRGLLAIMTVTGAFALAFTQLFLVSSAGAEIPAWAAAIVAGVTGFYFGSRSGSDTGAIAGMQAANQSAAQTASNNQQAIASEQIRAQLDTHWADTELYQAVMKRIEKMEFYLAAIAGTHTAPEPPETPAPPS